MKILVSFFVKVSVKYQKNDESCSHANLCVCIKQYFMNLTKVQEYLKTG